MARSGGTETAVTLAAIDIGTNTVLLLIARIDKEGTIHPLHHEQRLPRLGAGVDRHRSIQAVMFDRIAGILSEYAEQARKFGCERILAAATSAVRDAQNRAEFLASMKERTGISVELLSGEDEALWSYRGALSGLPAAAGPAAVLDIGGGSTEISWAKADLGDAGKMLQHKSLEIGAVRVKERYLLHDPPGQRELSEAAEAVRNTLRGIDPEELAGVSLIGVAGTVTTLACLDQNLPEFDLSRVSGYVLRGDSVGSWLRRLSSMNAEAIESLSAAAQGRADILTAGVLILHEFMTRIGADRVVVSERGLRYGLILRDYERGRNR